MRLRSLLFVPAREKMLGKIGTMQADAYIIDLEDSIEKENKQQALSEAMVKLNEMDLDTIRIYVRLNKENYLYEAEQLKHFIGLGFMLPKFESAQEYEKCKEIWKEHDVIALIETPKGLLNVKDIVECEWVKAMAFGAEDYTAKANMKNDYMNLVFHKNLLVTHGKAYDKPVYDTPSFQLADEEAFVNDVQNAVDIGFEGKLAINPKQLISINELFGAGDIAYMKTVVEEYESRSQAVLQFDGKIYEKMHIARFKRIIKENGGNE